MKPLIMFFDEKALGDHCRKDVNLLSIESLRQVKPSNVICVCVLIKKRFGENESKLTCFIGCKQMNVKLRRLY